ncbi:2-amino-4-hydroxy-6-hydroxymethyldihydropteridine diphosphokinase [Croceicoccus sp. Ery15]|uniref:2-amino-4-hydroxy-6- hydroxymethyldihydropteridine diphosphokinase n=1 Tax=Croceicoccus sp. Ery15 TaxID=1703338 RepID=UPI001E55AFAE|nr:2-amino-4-hydroxy-6-hydroxymethyldihydropteridine diphosphokinase [Croceicoccus sp. Ery15]
MAGVQGQLYLIGIGSNMRHWRLGPPSAVVRKAMAALDDACEVIAASAILRSAPVGPSARDYANAACVVRCALSPPAMLDLLNGIEHGFGRRRNGQRWRQRTLDLDILLWSGGAYVDRRLIVPHREMRGRSFVLGPAARIAGNWRDPFTGLSVRHMHARLTKRRPLPR